MNLTSLRQNRGVRTAVRRIGVHRVSTAAHLLQLPFLLLLRLCLSWVPRDPRRVVLGSPLDRFADNAAYLFVHLATQQQILRPTWISGSPATVARLRSQGLPSELRWSRRGVLACLRAGTFVYAGYRSDINRYLSPGAVAVGLWHGLPFKRVERGILGQEQGRFTRLSEAGREPPPDFLLSSTPYVTRIGLSPAFGVPEERCWELGYPRNDHLVRGIRPPAPMVWHDEYDVLERASCVVGLFLTWRDDRVDDVADTALVARLAAVCARHGAALTYKPHYNVQGAEEVPAGVVVLPGDADLHAYLGLCDVLVTDYSSIALDFPLTRRPSLYYMPDLEKYAATRGFYIDPHTLPGRITRTADALTSALEEVLSGRVEAWSQEQDEFLRLVWGDRRDDACAAVTAALTGLSEQQPPRRAAGGSRASRARSPRRGGR